MGLGCSCEWQSLKQQAGGGESTWLVLSACPVQGSLGRDPKVYSCLLRQIFCLGYVLPG